jgi:hypothetical protein
MAKFHMKNQCDTAKRRRLTRPQGAFVYTVHNEGIKGKTSKVEGRKYGAAGLTTDEQGAALCDRKLVMYFFIAFEMRTSISFPPCASRMAVQAGAVLHAVHDRRAVAGF